MKKNGGWTKTPNEIYDAIPLMSAPELLCTLILVRETYGYHRQHVRLTYRDFMHATGLKSKSTMALALKAVEARGFFCKTAVRSVWQIGEPSAAERIVGSQEGDIS